MILGLITLLTFAAIIGLVSCEGYPIKTASGIVYLASAFTGGGAGIFALACLASLCGWF